MKKVGSYLSGFHRTIHQLGDTLGPLSEPSALTMCYTGARYSQMYIVETESGLGHLPEVKEAHLKSSVCPFFAQFGEFSKAAGSQVMRVPGGGSWRI